MKNSATTPSSELQQGSLELINSLQKEFLSQFKILQIPKAPDASEYSLNPISINDADGIIFDPIIMTGYPDEIVEEYKEGNITLLELNERFQEYEKTQGETKNALLKHGLILINAIFTSMHGGHSINLIGPTHKDYGSESYTDMTSSFERIQFIGNVGGNDIFAAAGYTFGGGGYTGFGRGRYIVLVKDGNVKMAPIGDNEYNFGGMHNVELYMIQGNLLLSHSQRGYQDTDEQKDELLLLVDKNGHIITDEEMREYGPLEISPFQDYKPLIAPDEDTLHRIEKDMKGTTSQNVFGILNLPDLFHTLSKTNPL